MCWGSARRPAGLTPSSGRRCRPLSDGPTRWRRCSSAGKRSAIGAPARRCCCRVSRASARVAFPVRSSSAWGPKACARCGFSARPSSSTAPSIRSFPASSACSISAAARRRPRGWTSWKRWLSGTTACRRRASRSALPFVAAMLSLPCEDRYGPLTMAPRLVKEETIRVLVDVVKAAARTERSLVLFEDVHWADPTTLETIRLLIDRLGGIPVLVVLTHRPEFVQPWLRYAWVTTLDLGRLAATQSRELISNLTAGKALPPAVVEQIIAKTDGVPLFVEELTKTIIESGDLVERGDRYHYAGTSFSVAIPETLRDSLMARLDRFAPVKRIAQVGAVIGREFAYELIAEIEMMSEAALADVLSRLVASELAFCRGEIPDAVYTFKHALVQDAAYDSLLKSQRTLLHGKIARALEKRWPESRDTKPELLAHHYTAAGLFEAASPSRHGAGAHAP